MSRHRGIKGFVSRVRHSRGFGVHSPFAYSFITFTLHEHNTGYYIYPALKYNDHGNEKILKLLLRVLCRLHPSHVLLLPQHQPGVHDIIKEVDSFTTVNSTTALPDMIIVSPGYSGGSSVLTECLGRGGNVFFIDDNSMARCVTETMQHGMTFSNGNTLIAVGRHDLPRQHFELYF